MVRRIRDVIEMNADEDEDGEHLMGFSVRRGNIVSKYVCKYVCSDWNGQNNLPPPPPLFIFTSRSFCLSFFLTPLNS